MQKQKTIAKWLAVILLMTVAVACYVALSAIMGDKNGNGSNVAGANGESNGNQENINPPKPVYSTFPRKCENIDGTSVAHVGGEGEENVLDTLYFARKNIVVFSSESTQYDVKESGIYIAIFNENTLEKTIKIADKNGSYLAGCPIRNGIAIFTRDKDKTNVKVFDVNFEVTCENYVEPFDESTATFDGENIVSFCVKDGKIKCVKFDESLNVKKDNFVLNTDDAHVFQTIRYMDDALLFLQDGENVIGATYNQNDGFTKRFSYNKHRILQIMPVVQSNEQSFVALCKTQNGLTLYSLSSKLELTARFDVDKEDFGVLFRGVSGLNLVCKTRYIRLCSHLDFISETRLDYILDDASSSGEKNQNSSLDSNVENSGFSLEKAIDFACPLQEENVFIVRFDDSDVLVKLQDDKLVKIREFKFLKNIFATCGKTSDNQSRISLFFDCDSSSDLTYMCFGRTDVFFISLLTTSP